MVYVFNLIWSCQTLNISHLWKKVKIAQDHSCAHVNQNITIIMFTPWIMVLIEECLFGRDSKHSYDRKYKRDVCQTRRSLSAFRFRKFSVQEVFCVIFRSPQSLVQNAVWWVIVHFDPSPASFIWVIHAESWCVTHVSSCPECPGIPTTHARAHSNMLRYSVHAVTLDEHTLK